MEARMKYNITLGKLLGIIILIDLIVFCNIAFFLVNKSDILSVLYILLTVLSIVWGAKLHKNWIDKKRGENDKENY